MSKKANKPVEEEANPVEQVIDPMLQINLKLSEINAILTMLGKLPYGEVAEAIAALRDRGIKAIDKFNEITKD